MVMPYSVVISVRENLVFAVADCTVDRMRTGSLM
eukprot:SAG11_NODE_30518_length_300_cov_0.766169_2_plen_33_part_01